MDILGVWASGLKLAVTVSLLHQTRKLTLVRWGEILFFFAPYSAEVFLSLQTSKKRNQEGNVYSNWIASDLHLIQSKFQFANN